MKTIKLETATTIGIKCIPVTVEVEIHKDLTNGRAVSFPGTSDLRAREGLVRIVAAATSMTPLCTNASIVVRYRDPQGNELEHEPAFDLVAAIALMQAWGWRPIVKRKGMRYVGEIGFDGSVKPVRGALVRAEGSACVLPRENGVEFSVEKTKFKRIYVSTLANALVLQELPTFMARAEAAVDEYPMKLLRADGVIHDGETLLGRVLLAISEGRNVLLLGRPGSGKTMVARRVATRLDANKPLSTEDAVEICKIQSVAGLASGRPRRPFRAPHHSVSEAGLMGSAGRPGEVSLAHHGVLFLDEMNEFRRSSLSMLAQASKAKRAGQSHKGQTVSFPATTAIIGSASKCPCGRDPNCHCAPEAKERWQDRIRQSVIDLNMAIIDMDEA